jgi:putative ABC transport system permease protein
MHDFFQDLRYGTRLLLKRPGFSLIAVTTLALGIGANLTIFSFVDTLFFRPLPVQNPYQLVNVGGTRNGHGEGFYAYPSYAYLRDHSRSFESLVAHYSTAPLNIVSDGDSWEAQGAVVSANYFSTLGIRPLLGRFFLAEEDTVPDRDAVAVVSARLWHERFEADPSILEKDVWINGTVFRIIGVTPESFEGAQVGYMNDMWIPTMMLRLGYRWCDALNDADCCPLQILGRLAPDRTMAEAQTELSVLAVQLAAAYPEERGRDVQLSPAVGIRVSDRAERSRQMQLLLAVTGVLLLIACANVAGLLLVRGAARRKEIAVRLCMGAGRARLVRQFLNESFIIAGLGGALGLMLSVWGKDILLAVYTSEPRAYDLSLNPRVLTGSFLLTVLTAFLFGLMPAVQASGQDVISALKDESGRQSVRHSRWRNILVVGQVGLSLALLVSAGLLVRSAAYIRAGGNFDPSDVAVLRLRPRLLSYGPDKAQALTREVIRRLDALPGVKSVSFATGIGLAWLSKGNVLVRLPEETISSPEDEREVGYHEIAPRFFETLKIPLLEGRDFNQGDNAGSPRVTIINETLARRLWPDGSAVGRNLIVDSEPRQVVGVFKDAQLRSALEGPSPFLYVPFWQTRQTDVRIVVRVTGDPQTMLPLLRREISSVDSNVPITEEMAMTDQVNDEYRPVILIGSVAVCAGLIALLLSMVGLYSVLALAMTQRTREMGIRIALGAQNLDVIKLVVGQGMRLVLIGVGVGLGAAVVLSRIMANLLFGVSAMDPATFVLVASLLAGVSLVACYLPARRATNVDPMEALRYE